MKNIILLKYSIIILVFCIQSFHGNAADNEKDGYITSTNIHSITIESGINDVTNGEYIYVNPPLHETQDFQGGFPDNPVDPDVPVDGNVWLLFLAGLGMGYLLLKKQKARFI